MDHFAALRALRAIVDAGSFTAAAERLGTTHSAMSRQLRQLEEHLQVRLLDRNSRRLSLTEAGRDYYREAATLLDRLQEADDRARAGQAQPSGSVRISVPQVVASQELPHWLPSFLQRYPQVTLDLSADDQLVDVVGGGFDLALRIALRCRTASWSRASWPAARASWSPHRPTWRATACRGRQRISNSTRCWVSVPRRQCRPGSCRGRAVPPRASKPGSACAWMPRPRCTPPRWPEWASACSLR
jgi:DNA-binding transcriptional LysR family regulator